jgi:hypothetical protein
VLVRGEARRGGVVVLQCVRDELKGFPTLEIPEWMFDSHLCGQMKPAELPRVGCAALLALKHLLSAVTESSERDVVQAQHDSSSSGDADAQAVAVQDPSRRVVLSPAKLPDLPAEVRQKMARLLARMLKEHLLQRSTVVRPEVGNE